eukprot:scaffold269_cov404-Prasinococcus_capsulatus_cf.AAC.22
MALGFGLRRPKLGRGDDEPCRRGRNASGHSGRAVHVRSRKQREPQGALGCHYGSHLTRDK